MQTLTTLDKLPTGYDGELTKTAVKCKGNKDECKMVADVKGAKFGEEWSSRGYPSGCYVYRKGSDNIRASMHYNRAPQSNTQCSEKYPCYCKSGKYVIIKS